MCAGLSYKAAGSVVLNSYVTVKWLVEDMAINYANRVQVLRSPVLETMFFFKIEF